MSVAFGLHHISLYVSDLSASASFYADALGLEEIPNRVGKSHIRWFKLDEFRSIHIIGGDPVSARPRQMSTHVALATQSFDAALQRLTQHGVTYVSLGGKPKEASLRADGIRQVYFQDPDGHWLEINDADGEP